MFEFLVPLAGAAFVSARNVLIRQSRFGLARMTSLFSNFLFTAILAVPVVLLSVPSSIAPEFYWALPLSVTALTAARFFLFGALSSSALSAVIPLIAFAPIFITGTSFLILGEQPTVWGLFGLVAIVLGSYLLRIQSARAGVLEPFRVLAREPAARMMVGAALCFSVAAPFAKLSVESANPYFAFGVAQIIAVAGSAGWLAAKGSLGTAVRQIRRHVGWLAAVGVANFLQAIATYVAFDLMLAAYVSGIKGSNILMTALIGHLVFHERHLARSVAVGSLMVAGILLLSLQS